MKGIVFTELLQMVEDRFGKNMVDDVLEESILPSGGAYTSVGTYEHTELLEIVRVLSNKTSFSVRDLVKIYGHHLFFRFHQIMPQFFEKPVDCFSFLESVHDTIHVEVKKLYPEAKLPAFETQRINSKTLIMTYMSQCPFADFAEGLIQGCIDFYKENITVSGEDKNSNLQYCRIFTLVRE